MIPTKHEEMEEIKSQEAEANKERAKIENETINDNFYLLKLAKDYLVKGDAESLTKFREEVKKASGLGLGAVTGSLNSIHENSKVLLEAIDNSLGVYSSDIIKTEVLGDGGRPVLRKYENKDKKIVREEELDKNYGKLVMVATDYDDNGNLIRKTLYNYDADGKVTEETELNDFGELVKKINYKYDNEGNLIETRNSSFEYTDDGNIIATSNSSSKTL